MRAARLPLGFPWARRRVTPGANSHRMLRLRSARMPHVPPCGENPAVSAKCSEPVDHSSSGTSQDYSQSAVKLAAGLEPGRAGPAGQCTSTPSVKLGAVCVSAEAQTDLLIAERGQPVVNFLDSAECPFADDIPNCFHLGDDMVFGRSPWVPLIIEGVRVSMLLDTGAEVTILSTNFLHRLFPGQEFPDRGRSVRSLGGNHIAVKGLIILTIEICCQVLQHPVYFCDGATTPLLGYDVISAAALVIDTEARQVCSRHTVQCGPAVEFTYSGSVTSPTTEPSTATNSSAVGCSSTTTPTIVNSTATDSSTVYNSSTTADPSTTTPSAAGWLTAALSVANASTTRNTSTTPLEADRLPSCESSRPSLPPRRFYFFTDLCRPRWLCTYDSDRYFNLQLNQLHLPRSTCSDVCSYYYSSIYIRSVTS